MLELLAPLKELVKVKHTATSTGDNVFSLHCKTTSIILATFSILVTASQLVGVPITCISEKGLKEEVINTICWIKTTYTIPNVGSQEIYAGVGPDSGTEEVRHHNYYQWVCFVLFLQAIMFYFPRYLWKMWEGGLMKKLAGSISFNVVSQECKRIEIKRLTHYIIASMHQHNWYAFHFFFCETLNFLHVIGQIYMMDTFLDGEFRHYGLDVLKFAVVQPDFREDPMSRIFPKVTKCSFNRYGPSGSVQNYDILCILPINNINEKIFVFLWFWFLSLAFVSGLSLSYRFIVITFMKLRIHLLFTRARHIPLQDIETIVKRGHIGDWFLLHQLSKNVDPLTFHELILDLDRHLKHMSPATPSVVLSPQSESMEREIVSHHTKKKISDKCKQLA